MTKKIRLAIAGVGNCASSLVQGLEYYRDADPDETVPGLMHVELGGYHVHDVEVVAAFDVDAAKVGLDIGKAIFAGQNNTIRFASVGELGVEVQRGPTLDGLGKYYRQTIEESPGRAGRRGPGPARRRRRRARLLPAGRLGGGPAPLRRRPASRPASPSSTPSRCSSPSDPEWAQRFADAGVPIVGDDIKSQVGRDHRPPPAGPPVRGPGPGARPHLPAQRRRQHGLQEHARAGAAGVQEDLQDPGRHQPARQRDRGRRRPHRPVRPRARGWRTASGPTSGWRVATSATCPSTSSSSSRCGTPPTRRA